MREGTTSVSVKFLRIVSMVLAAVGIVACALTFMTAGSVRLYFTFVLVVSAVTSTFISVHLRRMRLGNTQGGLPR